MINRIALLCLLGFLAGCQTIQRDRTAPVTARFYLESADSMSPRVTLPRSGVQLAVGAKPVFTEFDIVDVDVVEVQLGKCLRFEFSAAAARDLYRLTATNQGRRLVLSLDGRPAGARPIDRPFREGTVLIFVEMPDEALPPLAENLRQMAGAVHEAAAK